MGNQQYLCPFLCLSVYPSIWIKHRHCVLWAAVFEICKKTVVRWYIFIHWCKLMIKLENCWLGWNVSTCVVWNNLWNFNSSTPICFVHCLFKDYVVKVLSSTVFKVLLSWSKLFVKSQLTDATKELNFNETNIYNQNCFIRSKHALIHTFLIHVNIKLLTPF